MMLRSRRSRGRRGIVLVAVAVSLLLMTAGIGLGIDLNRLLIAQRALRGAAEASALAAALEFDGSAGSRQRAHARAAALWQEQTARLGNPPMQIEFSEEGTVRVAAQTSTELSLLRTVVARRSVPVHIDVRARATVQVTDGGTHRSAAVLP